MRLRLIYALFGLAIGICLGAILFSWKNPPLSQEDLTICCESIGCENCK